MIHLATILHRTPGNIHRNSRNCRAKITSSVVNSDAGGEHFLIKGLAIDPTTTKTNYRQLAKVYLAKDGNVPSNPRVFVWCGCPWFKYFCEVALAIRGSSYIINANGALPKITNPTARPQTCKHSLTFLRKIMSNTGALRSQTVTATVAVRNGRTPKDKAIDDLVISRAKTQKRGGKTEAGNLGTRTL
jgi:hypothetical protein